MVVEVHVLVEDALEVSLTEEDEVVQTLLAKCAVESLHEGVGVRGLVRCGNTANFHQLEPLVEVAAHSEDFAVSRAELSEDAVVVVNEVTVGVSESEEIAELILDPEKGRVIRDGRTKNPSAPHMHDDEDVQTLKTSRVLREEVDREELRTVVLQEGRPRLSVARARGSGEDRCDHVLPDRGHRHDMSELVQLVDDAARSPGGIRGMETSDHLNEVRLDGWPPRPRAPFPEDAIPSTVPVDDCCRLNET